MNAAAPVTLEDKYRQPEGEVYLTGMQALVRLLLEQSRADRARGANTGGFVSGYRGSPIGGLDRELWRAESFLEEQGIRFVPALNEELAATACWGTQQVPMFPQPRVAGVYSLWYAKNPGLDRATDAIKHASHAGTSPLGGVLAVTGDDHLAKSSAFGHQSEYGYVDCLMPVLAPSSIAEIIELGLAGWALSRYCGAWIGFKLAGSICESSATIALPPLRAWPTPQFAFPADGPHLRWPDDAGAAEHRAKQVRLPAAQAFVRAAGLDRTLGAQGSARLGIVAAGRAHSQLRQAWIELGIAERDFAALGVRIHKPAMVWPIEPERLLGACDGAGTVLVVEDKRALIEDQLKVLLHDRCLRDAPRVIGKRGEDGLPLLPETGEIEAVPLALAIGARLGLPESRLEPLRARLAGPGGGSARTGVSIHGGADVRTPYFCSGCPHNTSTRAPEGDTVIGGIGCHTLAMGMDRGMLTFTHMGGEGASWIGLSPFTGQSHVFQNMGDGTYQHSGILGVRAAVAAGVNVTFKILYNDAVAMTGGQPVEGSPSVAQVTRQLAAEGVARVVVVSDEPGKYEPAHDAFATGVTIHPREELDAVQRVLREIPGVTALVYDQTCAAEKRRRRKAGRFPDPPRRLYINDRVCEGCGDCGVQSNCVSVVPLETAFGRKRQIDQASCNKDYSCAQGFCPSFVTIDGGRHRRAEVRDPGVLPPPPPPRLDARGVTRVLIAGIGGTGVVTVSAILGMAARLEGLESAVYDVTGMAQKGGPVLGHVQLAREASLLASDRIPVGGADLLIALDLVVAAMAESRSRLGRGTTVLANLDVAPTGVFTRSIDALPDAAELMERLREHAGPLETLQATRAAAAAAGDPIDAGLLMLGYALQRGLVPLRLESIEQAIRLNGVAVERGLAALGWGRRLAADPGSVLELGLEPPVPATLDDVIALRARDLAGYQNAALAARYRALLERVAAAEERILPGERSLARAVAENAYRLFAYKDEYEVARLLSDPRFAAKLDTNFEGDYRVRYHLAPPLFARRDPATGLPRKSEYGAWMRPLLAALARLKGLRGTPFDPFGYTAERRTERELAVDYVILVDKVIASLDPSNHGLAVELCEWPAAVRGYGHVKARSLGKAIGTRDALLARWGGATHKGR